MNTMNTNTPTMNTYRPQDSMEIIALEAMTDSLHACLSSMEEAKGNVPAGNHCPFHDVLTTYHRTLNRIADLRKAQLAHLAH